MQFAAVSGADADAAVVSLPVWTPATTEAFATYGVLDKGAVAQAVRVPSHVFADLGGLEVSTSSTALAELTDAYLYLQHYPYECAEQVASRLLATAALRDVLSAFKAPGMPKAGELAASLTGDLERLQKLQKSDGGWDFWGRCRRSCL